MAPAKDKEEIELMSRKEEEEELKEKNHNTGCLATGLGYAAVILSALTISLAVICAQALGGLLPPLELNGWRYTAQLIIVLPVLVVKWLSIFPKREQLVWVALASCLSVTFNLGNYTSAIYLPVGTVGGVGPSLWLIISALVTMILDRKCAYSISVACVVCVAGVLLVTQPPFLFKDDEVSVYRPPCGPLSRGYLADNISATLTQNTSHNSSMRLTEEDEDVAVEIGYLWLFGSAISACALFFIINRKLQNLNGFVICLWVSIVGILSQFVLSFIVEKPALPETPDCIGFLLGHCFGAGFAFVLMVFGNQLVIPAIFSLLSSLQVVYLFGAQYTFLRNVYPGKENWMEIFGAVLVLIGNVINPAFGIYEHMKPSYVKLS